MKVKIDNSNVRNMFVVIAFISMFVPFMVMVYLFSQLGPLGVIITILGLIGLGGGLICYYESNENPDRQ